MCVTAMIDRGASFPTSCEIVRYLPPMLEFIY